MSLELLTFGEALVEVMRTGIDQPLDRLGTFTGPYPSGAPFIFAAQAARLGMQVGVIGAVGDDAFGECLRAQLREDGIDARGIHVLPTHTTGVAFVAYNADGSRDFVFHARHAAAGQLAPEMLDPALFDGLKCLHIMGSTLSIHEQAFNMGLRALALAQAAGAKISFDPNLRPQLMSNTQARQHFAPFLDAADVFIPTADELHLLTGADDLEAGIQLLLDTRPERMIVITQGAEGCLVYSQAERIKMPGFVVEEIDPTGAGDCFDAGFLARWLKGDTLADAARYANACGALAVTAHGPMQGAKPSAEVEVFMRNHRLDHH
jgi:sugar/nucleoside kinase (ribokinase family)